MLYTYVVREWIFFGFSYAKGSLVDYLHRRESARGFYDTVEALISAVECHGFAVDNLHDICARLAAKGYVINSLVILEIVPARSMSFDISPFIPCRIAVSQENVVVVAALRPEAYSDEIAMINGATQRAEAERQLFQIVDAAVGSIDCEELPRSEAT